MPNITKTERTGSGETQYYDDGTSKFIQRPKGYFDQQDSKKLPFSNESQMDNEPVRRFTTDPDAPTEPEIDTSKQFFGGLRQKESDLREQRRIEAEKQVSAVEQEYQDIILPEAKKLGEGRLGEERSASSRAGILNQDFGISQKRKVEGFNATEESRLLREKQNKINAILTDFDNRANKDIAMERELAFAERDQVMAERENFLKEGKDLVQNLAATGSKYELFSPEDIEEMKRQTGMNDIQLEAWYNSNLPKEQQVKYTYIQAKDGSLVRTGDDGTTKVMGNYAPPNDELGWETSTIDGTPYWVKKNEQGDIVEFEKITEEKKRTQIREVGGREKLFDLDTGEVIKDLGPSKAPGSGGTKKDAGVITLNPTDKKTLGGAGFSTDDVTAIQQNLDDGFSVNEIYDAFNDTWSDEQKNAFNKVLKTQASETEEPSTRSQVAAENIIAFAGGDVDKLKSFKNQINLDKGIEYDDGTKVSFSLNELEELNGLIDAKIAEGSETEEKKEENSGEELSFIEKLKRRFSNKNPINQ